MIEKFSNHIVFVDESGSSNTCNIDPLYPLFVLCFFICKKETYVFEICPRINQFKFNYFGHSEVVLHERDIRKDLGSFSFLKTKKVKDVFINDLTNIIETIDGQIVCVVLDKNKLLIQDKDNQNLYHLALDIGFKKIDEFFQLNEKSSRGDSLAHIVFEKRGRSEDASLEKSFKELCDKKPLSLNYKPIFSDKKTNTIGLQLADLFARPLGMSVFKPDQKNRAVDIAKKMLLTESGSLEGGQVHVHP
jgi:hypothetical protein